MAIKKHQDAVGADGALTNAVPPNQRLTRILLTRQTNVTSEVTVFKIGTTSGGDDILSSTTILASDNLEIIVDLWLHNDTDTSLYLSATWNTATFRVSFEYKE